MWKNIYSPIHRFNMKHVPKVYVVTSIKSYDPLFYREIVSVVWLFVFKNIAKYLFIRVLHCSHVVSSPLIADQMESSGKGWNSSLCTSLRSCGCTAQGDMAALTQRWGSCTGMLSNWKKEGRSWKESYFTHTQTMEMIGSEGGGQREIQTLHRKLDDGGM